MHETGWIDHPRTGALHETKSSCYSFQQRWYGRHPQLCLIQVSIANWFADLLDLSYFQNILQRREKLLIQGGLREMYLYWPNCTQSDSTNLLLKVQIQDIAMEDGFEFLPKPMQHLLERGYWNCFYYKVPDKFWVIAPETLPSLDGLLHSCTDLDVIGNAGPFAGLHKAFGVFAEHYCDSNERQNLPLVSISNKFSEFSY
jgi:hypothetical protein